MAMVSSAPQAFLDAAERLRAASLRSELRVREIAAPEGIAPHAIAFAAGVALGTRAAREAEDDDTAESPAGAGRLVLLHDPDSADDWGGPFRFICFAQAPLEVEIGVDPFIADVAWSWLIDALESRGAAYSYASGTATKTLSTGFGSLEEQGDGAGIEIRASWTPQDAAFDLHAEAWSELLCLLAGLPPHEGVASLGARRAQRSPGAGA